MAERINSDELTQIRDLRKALLDEIGKVVIGKKNVVDLVFTCLLAQGHVLLEGVPGIAKTLIMKTFALALGCDFKRIQLTPDLLPSDILGGFIFNVKENQFDLRRGPVFTNILLADEINRAPAKTQSALLEAMEENQVSIEGETHKLSAPFMVMATQNPLEQEGVYRLPEAQMDRFIMRIIFEYPTKKEELTMIKTFASDKPPVNQVSSLEKIVEMQKLVDRVEVSDAIYEYILEIITMSREHNDILLGGSPRATIRLLSVARATALISGRGHVIPDDVAFMLPHVLNHRLQLRPEAELAGLTTFEAINQISRKAKVPENARS